MPDEDDPLSLLTFADDEEAAAPVVAAPPAEGWWIASDGKWYPPELHPDRIAAEQSAAALMAVQFEEPAAASSPLRSVRSQAPQRPVAPGFRRHADSAAADTTDSLMGARPLRHELGWNQPRQPQLPSSPGFEEAELPMSAKLPLTRRPSGSQKLMGVADVLTGSRSTVGGPRSAVPPVSTSEMDFFVVRPTRKKVKKVSKGPRPRLASFTFAIVIIIVLASVTVAFFVLHH